jgi:MoxR-like ATPase
MEGNYKHRVVDALLERKLLGKGAVLLEGAKWCGKTTTSSRLAKSMGIRGRFSDHILFSCSASLITFFSLVQLEQVP